MWIGEGSIRGGVGQTPQEAIAGALRLALRRVSERFNAADVETIQVTKYPWFVVAKVNKLAVRLYWMFRSGQNYTQIMERGSHSGQSVLAGRRSLRPIN